MFEKFTHRGSRELITHLLRTYVWPHKMILALGIFCMLVTALTTTVLAQYLKPIFDDIFLGKRADLLWPTALGVLAVFVAKGLSNYGEELSMDYVGQRLVLDIQTRLFGHIMTLDVPFFHQTHGGKLLSVLTSDVSQLRSSVITSITSMVKDFFTFMGLLGFMIVNEPLLTAVSLLGLPLVLIPLVQCGRRLRKLSFQTQEATASLYTFFQQIFQGICLVKASQREAWEVEVFKGKRHELFCKTYKATKIGALVHPLMEILSGIAITLVLVYGGLCVIAGERSTGAFASFITALIFMYRPLKNLVQLNNHLQTGLAAADRIFHVLAEKPVVEAESSSPLLSPLPHPSSPSSPSSSSLSSPSSSSSSSSLSHELVLQDRILFDEITFTYPHAETPLFSNFSCSLPAGKRLALVGHSGAGKTSLFYLLLRFYQPSLGRIMIDNVPIERIPLRDLRSKIALVSQEITLFDDTIYANIAYGMPNPTLDEVRHASALAFADEFIERLPQGYDTRVGENGVKLSGGQRQRIALARAFAKNAPLLLLDEATSSLDAASEKKVQKALFRLLEGRTAIIIAHRLSTIEAADRIFVLNKGQLIEEGTHTELFARQSHYWSLVLSQYAGTSSSDPSPCPSSMEVPTPPSSLQSSL